MVRVTKRIAFAIFIWFALGNIAIAAQTTGFGSTFELADGTELEAQLQSIDSQSVEFVVGEEKQRLAIDAVDRIRFADKAVSPEATTRVKLIDGSELNCKLLEVSGRDLIATTECGLNFKLSTRLVDSALLDTSNTPEFQKQWRKITATKRESDALVVSRDQKLQMVDGVLGDVAPESVTFTVGERTADVKRERLAAILFYRRIADEIEPANFVFGLADGSRIHARQLSVDEQRVSVVSSAGAKFEIDPNIISDIDFQEGRSVWLSDLDPASNDWEPLLTNSSVQGKLKQFSRARLDKSFGGKDLSILVFDEESDSRARREFAKGFSIKGGGKLSFLLARQYRQLTGSIGFDPDANSTGIVKLVIQVDGSNRVEQVLDASKMRGPFPIEVDLVDASRIVFNVEYHDRRNVGDILHAVDLKLHR